MKPTAEWTDRERVLLLCSRGCLARTRHLMNDLKRLMPHVHSEAKFEKGKGLENLNEIGELANCSKCIYLESRKGRDVYMWVSQIADGPSIKFLVHNMHTMSELSMTGNCLKGSRPILSFDSQFDTQPHLKVVKELFMNIFKTPNHHPRSQPFIDHVFNFSLTSGIFSLRFLFLILFISDGNVWFRNYQIVDDTCKLEEIGPRMVFEIIRVFDGSFCGTVMYENPTYKTPNSVRREIKLKKADEYAQRVAQKQSGKVKEKMIRSVKMADPVGEVFDTDLKEVQGKGKAGALLDRQILKKKKQRKAKAKKTAETLKIGSDRDAKRISDVGHLNVVKSCEPSKCQQSRTISRKKN
uniref:Ribosome biogenesis protein BRX1 homolog n=1 Tax=Ditylenchus dipsaci TaxID=166011 RepID=A0A915EKF9_9BILA